MKKFEVPNINGIDSTTPKEIAVGALRTAKGVITAIGGIGVKFFDGVIDEVLAAGNFPPAPPKDSRPQTIVEARAITADSE